MARKPRKRSTRGRTDAPESITAFLAEAGKYELLANEEEQALAVRCEQGDREAMDKLVTHNLKFAVTIANELPTGKVLLEDAVGSAILGMYTAAKKFKPCGVRFISYAVWWIRAELQAHTMPGETAVRRPPGIQMSVRIVKEYEEMHGMGSANMASPQEIRDDTGHPLNNSYYTDGSIEMAKSSLASVLSLDAPMAVTSDRDGAERIDYLRCTKPGPDEFIDRYSAEIALEAVLPTLSERERVMVEARYLSEEPPTLDVLGAAHGLTRERTRQVVEEALWKMRVRHRELLADALGDEGLAKPRKEKRPKHMQQR